MIPFHVIEELFEEMYKLWGKRFEEQWNNLDMLEMQGFWHDRLQHLEPHEVLIGKAKLHKKAWPINVVEFAQLCRPRPEPYSAFLEAIEGLQARKNGSDISWSHPSIFFAANRVSSHDLQSSSYEQIRERWTQALEAEFDRGQWPPIPPPTKTLPAPLPKRNTEGEVWLIEIREMLKNRPRSDRLGWARKIVERHKAGDSKITPGVLEQALMALKTEEY